MKARTRAEKECMELSKKIPKITKAQEKYAIEHCFTYQCIKPKKQETKCICLECGEEFEINNSPLGIAIDDTECPHCHKKLKASYSRRRKGKVEKMAYQVVTQIKDWQVIRTFYLSKYTVPGKPAIYNTFEAVRRFMKSNQSDIIIARPRHCGIYMDLYDFSKPMSIKKENNLTPYDISADVVYPRWGILPIVKRNGFCQELKRFDPYVVISRLMNYSKYETLAKTKRFDIWAEFRHSFIETHWRQIKMLIRHNYYPEDYKIWEDTVIMAERNGFDALSPKYVLPKDLQAIHDYLVKVQIKRDKEREIAKHKKDEKAYIESHGRWFGIELKNENIALTPLRSYEDFFNEGKAMHHCVAGYISKRSSLILSAKRNGERVATVELSIDDWTILQCRAYCNKKPEEYDEICNLVNRNINVFKKAARQ